MDAVCAVGEIKKIVKRKKMSKENKNKSKQKINPLKDECEPMTYPVNARNAI